MKKQMAVSSYTPHLPPPSHKHPFTKPKVTFTKRGRCNPVDTTGQTTRCGICDSVNLWAHEYPDQPHQSTSAYFTHATADPDVLDTNYVINDVALFQSDFDSPTHLHDLVAESWNHAVLHSRASKTVCGLVLLNTYVACLNVDDKSRVSYSDSSSIFVLGMVVEHQPHPLPTFLPTLVINNCLLILMSLMKTYPYCCLVHQ